MLQTRKLADHDPQLLAWPQLELYAELREALAAAHAEAIAAGLGKRGQVALVRTERPH
jgi:hypothetical protein